jgi:hypothetical protein
VRRPSTLLTRLALALLAVMGFVAPLSAMEVDRVVQTVGGKPSAARETREAFAARAPASAPAEVEFFPSAPLPEQRSAEVARRYLLHRAWLI